MKLELNIGLFKGRSNELLSVSEVLEEVEKKFKILSFKLFDENTEPTLWLKVEVDEDYYYKVYDLSLRLYQEAIAVYKPFKDEGELIGIKADEWGEFNLSYFVRP